MTRDEAGLRENELVHLLSRFPLEDLRRLDGYYDCPKDAEGKRLGPLVGYAGKDEQKRQKVGDVYANFAMSEEWAELMFLWATALSKKIREKFGNRRLVICAAPLGAMTIGPFVALQCNCRYIYPEKKVTAVATETSREESVLVFDRHKVRAGDEVVILEDVTNNFSTTQDLIKLIEKQGGTVVGIACLLNRSLTIGDTYCVRYKLNVPVISLVRKKIMEYIQDDPKVSADIASGNVVWKPKNDWPRLKEAMDSAQ